MNGLTTPGAIEIFHLAFLGTLPSNVDPSTYVLKGGANLRYFFESVRYSEDIDLDVIRLKAWQLDEKVDRVLDSKSLSLTLRSTDVSLAGYSKPKQTDTTQRWKVELAVRGEDVPVRTKVEFSHRSGDDGYSLEFIPDRITDAYAIRPVSAQHYDAGTALEQKIRALTGRSETQSRDVFDLELLLRRNTSRPPDLGSEEIGQAIDRAIELPFEAFRDQVVRFLEPEVMSQYDSARSWERMQTYVAGRLEEFT